MSQLVRLWYLPHRRPVKAQARIRHLAPPDVCKCAFEEWVYGGESTIISWAGSNIDPKNSFKEGNVVPPKANIKVKAQDHYMIWRSWILNEPPPEIMVLVVLCKFIFQTYMRNHPVGVDVWYLVGPFVSSILHVCEQRRLWRDCADAQARLSLRWSPIR